MNKNTTVCSMRLGHKSVTMQPVVTVWAQGRGVAIPFDEKDPPYPVANLNRHETEVLINYLTAALECSDD